MKDTPINIQKKQLEIFMAKSEEERLTICLEMIDFGRSLAETGIKENNPKITAADLKAELFKLFYKKDFETDELEKIADWLKTDILTLGK
jgi:hypothetical protein